MIINIVNKKKIIRLVKESIKESKKEVLATMLLQEEIENPLPSSYHALLQKRAKKGVKIKRLGFGSKVDYNLVKNKLSMPARNYQFRYVPSISTYQRLLIIDRKILFFGIDGVFFQSSYKPLVKVFVDYFTKVFKKGKS
ncbi:MAG: hypothetical protein WD992_01020 [Candidatus Levyibacteriota bacterium]